MRWGEGRWGEAVWAGPEPSRWRIRVTGKELGWASLGVSLGVLYLGRPAAVPAAFAGAALGRALERWQE
jgi:hypothetical protein